MEIPAIMGGKPFVSISLTKPSPVGNRELLAVNRVLKSGVLSKAGRGKFVKSFEKAFASFFKVKYAISTTSGTTALHTAIVALGIKTNDEVLVPALTFVSSASVILEESAKPVFVDIDPKTFCMDTKDLENKINKHTKAIMVVHLYGHPADMVEIVKIAKKHKLKIIEDCAQAHGAMYKGKLVGTFGDLACFSFYQTKNMTCGEGGMVITNNKELSEKCYSIVDHGLLNGFLQGYDYDRLGYNYHLTELQAAIGIEQLSQLNSFNAQRRKNAALYRQYLKHTELEFQDDSKNIKHVYYNLTALLPKKLKHKRDWFFDAVKAENVEINKLYPVPLHKTKLFKQSSSNSVPNSEDAADRLFNFYTNPGVSANYIKKTCEAVIKILNYLQ